MWLWSIEDDGASVAKKVIRPNRTEGPCIAYEDPHADVPSPDEGCTPGVNDRLVGWGLCGSWCRNAALIQTIKTKEGR
jgi:hypothetical protein